MEQKVVGSTLRKSNGKEKEIAMIRTHMHRQEPSFVDRFAGYAKTAGNVYGAAQTFFTSGEPWGQPRAVMHPF